MVVRVYKANSYVKKIMKLLSRWIGERVSKNKISVKI